MKSRVCNSVRRLALALAGIAAGGFWGAALADCGNDGAGFARWLERFKARAAGQGISDRTIASALADVTYDRTVVRLDRSQRSFKRSFEQFYARRVGEVLIRRGRAQMLRHRATLQRIEKRFGVPGAVLVAIWGLETNFGADTSGRFSILRSVATLAYDCRRPAFFEAHLVAALRIVERGDMTPAELRGGWAGEIGQVQFLPGAYVKYAVDFDGDGKRDLVRSVPDLLASTASYLEAHGWRRGAAWEPGTANYAVIKSWNRAEVYQRTIAVMAARLSGGA
jgi:lytic murein transglycosylase